MMKTLAMKCTGCDVCVKECAFLQYYGNPGKIAADFYAGRANELISFECSLCGLCSSLCPKHIDPCKVFFQMRNAVWTQTGKIMPEHKAILAYEKKGLSKRYSLYKLPDACTTVFFPGCTFTGTRTKRTEQIYSWLKNKIPGIGIVLDCCAKPSHDLGRDDFFNKNFLALEHFLYDNKVKTVITACPNCYTVFSTYSKKLKTKSIYEILAKQQRTATNKLIGCVTVHDPCVTRFETDMHNYVRKLLTDNGLEIKEMKHCREKTVCCGEGGSVLFVAPDFASNWGNTRKKEAADKRIITYCAGCCSLLGKTVQTDHVLDLLFEPEKTMQGSVKPSSAPFTYFHRLNLKRKLKKQAKHDVMEKVYFPVEHQRMTKIFKVLIMVILAAGVAGIKMTGAEEIFNQEAIQTYINGFGSLAPLVYMIIVAFSPVFFLPGAPFIIAGGLIFGPFQGVVYGITGATSGACLAFLVSRYVASEWIESKLTNPSWLKLKRQTEKHGWKIVAITRLVPLVPFNLLSYALGLTRIKFTTYFITSFICMLPGCIGYILLSGSVLEVLQGKLSIKFFAGLGIIILLSLIPVFFKKIKPEDL
ncbi:VTT domain-containing protein [Desulfobacula phenolica]|uniref:Uncharacterized membrane protein YdjX, TVP38/TMEM64 family, SNARE-associated domain n=1 Tax=Desulfobacula phenolica TaxID=90732 RepID=A0A1H2JG65_9BACT|nr:VTT domain-containing protein [Desulfobacula phenolica]SDU55146.1 Uncharacterized membrane protein YdjX, TVP38/TMEM64 family, SNARE-associated domain [Desulfobacula phenolica]